MPINLERAENIGNEKDYYHSIKYGTFTVLNKNKVPFYGSSLLEKGFYKCPFCRDLSIKQIIEWRCEKCDSKVIYWKCYTEEKEDKHIFYELFIKNFEDSIEYMIKAQKAKKDSRKRGDN